MRPKAPAAAPAQLYREGPKWTPPSLASDAHDRWRKSFCGSRCSCNGCVCRRAIERADESPALSSFDLDDPAVRAEFERAFAVVDEYEAERRRRIAAWIAVERMSR